MKKNTFVIVLYLLISLSAKAQEPGLQKIFNLLYETSIKPFTGDTAETRETRDEKNAYLLVDGTEHRAEIKIWQPDKKLTLVALTLTESDMVMSHQEAKFYLYKNGLLEETQPLPNLHLASFFHNTYLEQNKVDGDEELPSPIIELSPDSYRAANEISIYLQDESFDSTYMGPLDRTRLDPSNMAVRKIVMAPEIDGRFYIVGRQYPVDRDLELYMQGGWESWCEETVFFSGEGEGKYRFSNEFSRHGHETVTLMTEADSVKLRERFDFVYGKRMSETEGTVFYDQRFVKDSKTIWKGQSVFRNVKLGKDMTFILGKNEPAMKEIRLPGINKTTADKEMTKAYPEVFDLPAGTDPQIKAARSLKLYPYAVEIEITLYKEGKPVKKNLYFKIRYGEC